MRKQIETKTTVITENEKIPRRIYYPLTILDDTHIICS